MSTLASNIAHTADFAFDRDLRIWQHPQQEKFAYSDGEKVEKKILEILRNASDLSLFPASLLPKSQIGRRNTISHPRGTTCFGI